VQGTYPTGEVAWIFFLQNKLPVAIGMKALCKKAKISAPSAVVCKGLQKLAASLSGADIHYSQQGC
jgi:hypothetical protein